MVKGLTVLCVYLYTGEMFVCSILTKFATKYTQRRVRIACVDMCNYLLYNLLIISTYLPHDFIIFYLLICKFKVKLPKQYIMKKIKHKVLYHISYVQDSYLARIHLLYIMVI